MRPSSVAQSRTNPSASVGVMFLLLLMLLLCFYFFTFVCLFFQEQGEENVNELILENLRTHSLVYIFINSSLEVGLCALHIFVSLRESWWYSHTQGFSVTALASDFSYFQTCF